MFTNLGTEMAFVSAASFCPGIVKSDPAPRRNCSHTRACLKTSFLPEFLFGARRRVQSKHLHRFTSSTASGNSSEEQIPQDEKEHDQFVEKLDAKPLRWAEIPFSSIQEELKAIDDYEREEELKPEDVWPKFLKGAAYEHWGQPQLALAQYAKTDLGGGLRRVPELWERRAYNSFKIGKVGEANAYFDVGLTLFQESCGNELHFVHWFYSNFEDYIPKWNGPPAPIQRGICKYCMGELKQARESFLPQILLRELDIEHTILWLLASSAKMTGKDGLVVPRDIEVVNEALREEYEWDSRLRLFVELFSAYGENVMGRVSEAENRISEAIKADKNDDVTSYVYLALYHDAFTGDAAERDRALDSATAMGSTPVPNDTENFLFCAAKNRISAPPDAKSAEIPETTRM